MKNKKITAIFVMLVLTVATGLAVASGNEKITISDEDLKQAIEDARMTLPFEKEEVGNEIPPLPNPFMITDLKEGWNMMGYPNQGTVDIDVLAVIYNDTVYTWTEAWQQDIILRFVYEWDRDLHHYDVVDEIEGGYGYWMWAYFDCELWSLY